MNERQFWQRATDLLNYYRSRFDHCILTDDEKTAEVGSFLNDVLELRDEWHSRNVPAVTKETTKK